MSYIPEELRRQVIERANFCCEYCLLPLEDDFIRPEIDHIIAEKHHGETTEDNLCLSCLDCNRHKGSDFASFTPDTREFSFLFNPRKDTWSEHFQLNGTHIEPLTQIGKVTVSLLHMNAWERIRERAGLIRQKRYPCAITGGE